MGEPNGAATRERVFGCLGKQNAHLGCRFRGLLSGFEFTTVWMKMHCELKYHAGIEELPRL